MALRLVLFLLVGGFLVKGTDAVKSKYVCQGQKLRLRCNRHDVLRIYSANYGRLEPGTSICPHQNISSLSCRAPNVLSKMRVRCDNKPKCTVRADGAVFGDPCPETYKYFEVIYGCGNYWTPTPRATKTARKPKHNHNRTTLSAVKFTTWKTPKAISITTTTPITTLHNIPTSTTNTRSQPTKIKKIVPGGKTVFPSASLNSLTTQARVPPHNTPEMEFSGRRERPQYTLVVFLSAVAGATAFLLILLLGVHLCKRRRRKRNFSMEDAEVNEPEESKKQKTITIEIQNSDDETKEINVNPGDIIIIDHNDANRPGSEDLGYLSEIVRLYNSQDIESDDQISIRKLCPTCDSPSVISTEPSDCGTRDSKCDSAIRRCTCQTSSLLRPSSPLCIM